MVFWKLDGAFVENFGDEGYFCLTEGDTSNEEKRKILKMALFYTFNEHLTNVRWR
jgi:hypothetical protein